MARNETIVGLDDSPSGEAAFGAASPDSVLADHVGVSGQGDAY
jgi:hypothetical protein